MSKKLLETWNFTKFLRSIELIFIKNYNLSSNLKIGYCGPKTAVWMIGYSDERISDKKLRFTEIERWNLYEKIKTIGNILVELQDGSIICKIA